MSTPGPVESRVSKPRLPKAYTKEQLVFLRSNLDEFERKSQGFVRGDAKKFALEKAGEFILTFGLPSDVETGPDVDTEAKFKEQIYNWFKNTVGRTRRKMEGRSRRVKKSVDKEMSVEGSSAINWNTNLATPTIMPYAESHNNPETVNATSPSSAAMTYGAPQSSPSSAMSPHLNLTPATLREALLTPAVNPSTLSSMFQAYILSHPSSTPLTPIVHALFDAISTAEAQSPPGQSHFPGSSPVYTLVRRFLDACSYFPPTVAHAAASGPAAGPRALQMQIRKCSMWAPHVPALARPGSAGVSTANGAPASSSTSASPVSMTDEMQRIAADRQRRKDFIHWARMHAAALELGLLGGSGTGDSMRPFSEMVARDSVWEDEEVEWVAGICVLSALIRTAGTVDARQRDEYRALLAAYEGRWKEIRDEGRQELVTDWLVEAKRGVMTLDDHYLT